MSKPSPANVVKAYGAIGPDGDWYEDDGYDRYSDADYGYDAPPCEEQDFFHDLEKMTAQTAERFFRQKVIPELKSMRWSVKASFDYGLGEDMVSDREGWVYYVGGAELKGKAGQKLLLPRNKAIVLDRNVDFDIGFWVAMGDGDEEIAVGTGKYTGDGWNEPRQELEAYIDIECPDPKDIIGIAFAWEGEEPRRWFKPSQVNKMLELFSVTFPKEVKIRSKIKKRAADETGGSFRAASAGRVASAYRIARSQRTGTEHATEEARKKHLKEHPNADPSDHTVEKKEKPEKKLDLGKSLEKSKGVKKKVDEKLDELFDFAGASQYTSKG